MSRFVANSAVRLVIDPLDLNSEYVQVDDLCLALCFSLYLVRYTPPSIGDGRFLALTQYLLEKSKKYESDTQFVSALYENRNANETVA